MKPAKIYYTPEFVKLWKRVPKAVRQKAVKKEALFRKDVYHSQLKTHKLKGKLQGFHSFSVDYHWRIVFHLQGKNAYFDAIGTHSVYK